jgi:hypothetical protein
MMEYMEELHGEGQTQEDTAEKESEAQEDKSTLGQLEAQVDVLAEGVLTPYWSRPHRRAPRGPLTGQHP